MSESSSDSSLKKLLERLNRSGLLKRVQLSDEDIADSIWLALQMGVTDLQPPKESKDKKEPQTTIEIEDIEPRKTPPETKKTIDVITEESLPQEQEKPAVTQGFPFQVPAAPALQKTLPISRALRPLMRKVPSATKTMLDEEATATRIAERDIWLPVTKPQPERWLTLELVIEESRSSFIWQELVDDLQKLLENQGAFYNIRVWSLSTPEHQKLQLVRRRKGGKSTQRYHPHRELIHPSGRGLVLLVSDCVSPIWKKALIHPWLKEWSEKQPTAIIQLFPERLWNSTQLGRGRKLFTTALIPGVTNPKLVLKNYPSWLPIEWHKSLLLPVVTLEADILKQWAGVVAGVGHAQISAFLFDLAFIEQQISQLESHPPVGEQGLPPSNLDNESNQNDQDKEETIKVRERAEAIVERFFATASEPAKRLAGMMAAAPVSMPVVNLIRKTLLREITPVHVAEVYMGGLLKPLVENEDGQFRVYDFLPGVRQVLNQAIGRRKTTKVLDAISQYIAEKIDCPMRSFAALLTLLPQYNQEQQAQILPFAQVAVEVLRNLGGEYAAFAEEVAVNIKVWPPGGDRTSEDEGGMEPQLQTCTFDVATIEIDETITFEFDVATLERKSQRRLFGLLRERETWTIKRQRQQAQCFIEDLENGVQLEMVAIPEGSFVMGSPEDELERSQSESPQHTVTIKPFFLGKYPVTQAQWQAVASLPQVNRKLDPDPSGFKGANRPVERVSWGDAVEFCDRLSRYTDKPYRLPTEAEWEYACRAVIPEESSAKSEQLTVKEWNEKYHQPFHFGETISTELANYDGNSTYGRGVKGKNRGETTPVGDFKFANAFGLYDMHGNVWEWCEDDWHKNYNSAPNDGSAWLSKEGDTKVLRGGSWIDLPRYCRSASRHFNLARDGIDGRIGFRVACVLPRTY